MEMVFNTVSNVFIIDSVSLITYQYILTYIHTCLFKVNLISKRHMKKHSKT